MTLKRRRLMLVGAAALVVAALPQFAFAQASTAAEFVQTNGNRILTLASGAQTDASQRQALLDVVETGLDVDGIASFALGPYARQASPEQLARYTKLFHQVISTGVTARLAAYQNATFTIGRSDPRGEQTLVHSTITRPGSPPASVDWLVGTATGGMRILDVIAEGTSLRQTERSDYTSYLQSHGGSIDALLTAIEGQIAR